VWYRKEVELTPEQANSAAVLQLGTIDDCDETYVNGQKLGGVCQWDAVRKYALPQGLLKQGKNLIAVKVTDTGGGGGFHGDPAVIKMILGQTEIPLAGTWKARVADYMKKNMPDANDMPTLLFNAMLHPLLPYPIKGVLWYQGESNVPRAAQYATSFPQMITDWRARWKEGNFPFYFVQLAAYLPLNRNTLAGSTWAELRDAQRQTLALPNTCMTVTTDIGDANDIHPRNKQDVGLRLAACALKKDYNKDVVESGPVYKAMEIRGNSIELQFDSIGSGLMAKDKYGYLYGFTIAGEDQQFKWAKATIQGDKVIVSSTEVPNPVAVRFGWVDNPSETNLYNKEGFPASIFRTDTWKRLTDGVKFGN
jgi:sialate O-acetylesterase